MTRNFTTILFSLVLTLLPIQMMADGKKVALVIGNANYSEDSGFKSLSNPLNDARAIANKLSSLGFMISGNKPLLDGTKRQMSAAIEQFMYDSRDADVVLFYYSGHGASRDNKEALLLPLGETFKEFNFRESCIGLETVISAMNRYDSNGKSKLKIIFLDACRNAPYSNPLDKSKGAFDVNKGLVRITPPNGFAICYATAPGETAIERANERYSVYTEALLAELSSGKNFSNMMAAVSQRVKDKTNNRQAPKFEHEFSGDFSFVSNDTSAKLELPSKNTVVVDKVHKQSVTTPYHQTGFENGHEWVDLGLPSGTKWATCNIGASTPEEFGEYFAWGETTTKPLYDINNYLYCINPKDPNNDSSWRFYSQSGKKQIDPNSGHDVARIKWGGAWRMPTDAENEELCKLCTWTWFMINDSQGCLVTGPNGKKIFLPAGGVKQALQKRDYTNKQGFYWSSTLSSPCSWSRNELSQFLQFNNGSPELFIGRPPQTNSYFRECGLSVRPVFNE